MFKKCVCGSAVLLVLCLVPSSLAQQMGAWTFDEGSGTTAKDVSGNGNNGRLMGGPTWVPGKFGKALKFDGVDDYVEILHNVSLLPPGNEETVSAWIYAERYTGPNNEQWQGILSKGDAPRLYSLYTDNGGQNLHFSTGASGAYQGTVSTTKLPPESVGPRGDRGREWAAQLLYRRRAGRHVGYQRGLAGGQYFRFPHRQHL